MVKGDGAPVGLPCGVDVLVGLRCWSANESFDEVDCKRRRQDAVSTWEQEYIVSYKWYSQIGHPVRVIGDAKRIGNDMYVQIVYTTRTP